MNPWSIGSVYNVAPSETARLTISSTCSRLSAASFNFFLLFHYDAKLALVSGGLVFVSMAVTFGLGYLRLRYQREMLNKQGRISGIMLQLFNGISKFKVAAAEWIFAKCPVLNGPRASTGRDPPLPSRCRCIGSKRAR
jgi:hypothetical protein